MPGGNCSFAQGARGMRRLIGSSISLLLATSFPVWASDAEWLYKIKPGDTLINVASAYLKNPNDWPRLQTLNQVHNPKRLKPGSLLRLPVGLLKREAALAEVVYVQGKVSRTPKNGAQSLLSLDDQLQVGDVIETSDNASVSLRFVDGSRLLLTPGTRVILAEMILFGKTGMARTVIEMHRGSIDTRVTKQSEPAARYEIKSRPLNLSVRGTDFRIRINDTNQAATAEVLEGLVAARGMRGNAVAVPGGYGTLAVPGGMPRAPLALPAAPDLSHLPDLIERLPLRFTFSPNPGVTRYRAQVYADRSFERLLLDGVFDNNQAKWADLPDGRYVLRMRALDQNGLEGMNADREFVLNARPEPPFISAPLDGQKSYGSEALLRWTASLSAQTYHIQVSTKPDFQDKLADLTGLTTTEHALPLAPGQYYWRIAAVAAGQDHGPFSDVQGFSQRKIPESPKMEAPAIQDEHVVFRWAAGEPGSQYQLQIARDPEFSQPILDKVIDTEQIQIDRPEPGAYYLRIKTIDADGFAGPFGAPQKLDIPASKWWMLFFLLLPLPFVM